MRKKKKAQGPGSIKPKNNITNVNTDKINNPYCRRAFIRIESLEISLSSCFTRKLLEAIIICLAGAVYMCSGSSILFSIAGLFLFSNH